MVIVSRKEIEQLRPWISSQVKSILGFSEDTVVNAAVDCLAKSLSRNVATGKRARDELTHKIEIQKPNFLCTVLLQVLCNVYSLFPNFLHSREPVIFPYRVTEYIP